MKRSKWDFSITLEDIQTFTSISKISTKQTQSGLKLDSNNNYDIEGNDLPMLARGLKLDDAVVMHQMESFDTDFETKLAQLKADSLQMMVPRT